MLEKKPPESMLRPSGEKESGLQGKYGRRTFLGRKCDGQSTDMQVVED